MFISGCFGAGPGRALRNGRDVVSPELLSADPDDDYLIDLARDAQVEALVTGDAHLLELRAIIPAMTPAEFLELVPGR